MNNLTPIQSTWLKIEHWLRDNIPILYDRLNPPATEADFAKFKEVIGFEVPQPFKELYSMRNGSNGGLFFGREWAAVETIAPYEQYWMSTYEDDFDDDQALSTSSCVKELWWNEKQWLPFTGSSNPYNGSICMDLDPAEGGTVGQIIEVWLDHSFPPSRRLLVANSLEEYLEFFYQGLVTGTYRSRQWVGEVLIHSQTGEIRVEASAIDPSTVRSKSNGYAP